MICLHCKGTRIDPERFWLYRKNPDGIFAVVAAGSSRAMASEWRVMLRRATPESSLYHIGDAPCSGCGEGEMMLEKAA